MLNEFLQAAYNANQVKVANRQLIDRFKQFSIEDLRAFVEGDPLSKLAYCCDGPSVGAETWLDKYKGSPLFEKAVALEKAMLEADAAADAKRSDEREADRSMEDQRDSIRMQKRMLDLDLALEQSGAAPAPPPSSPVPAQAPEAAAGAPAVEVKAAAVGALIPEARSTRDVVHAEPRQGAGALGDYAVSPSETVTEGLQVNKTAEVRVRTADAVGRLLAKTATVPGFADELSRLALLHGGAAGAGGGYLQGRRAGELGIGGALSGGLGATSGSYLGGLLGQGLGIGATRLLAHTPVSSEALQAVMPVLRAAGAVGGGALGFHAGTAGQRQHIADTKKKEEAKKQKQASVDKTAISHTRIIQAVKHTPQLGRLNKAFEHGVEVLGKKAPGAVIDQADTLAQAAAARLGGGDWKRKLVGMNALRKAAEVTPNSPQAFYEEVVRKYPKLGKKKEAGIAGSLMQGMKTLGTGAKNLATTAHAAGGMPQVVSSFGNVAKNFAQRNPLAATGIAAGAAGLGGMALGRATAPGR